MKCFFGGPSHWFLALLLGIAWIIRFATLLMLRSDMSLLDIVIASIIAAYIPLFIYGMIRSLIFEGNYVCRTIALISALHPGILLTDFSWKTLITTALLMVYVWMVTRVVIFRWLRLPVHVMQPLLYFPGDTAMVGPAYMEFFDNMEADELYPEHRWFWLASMGWLLGLLCLFEPSFFLIGVATVGLFLVTGESLVYASKKIMTLLIPALAVITAGTIISIITMQDFALLSLHVPFGTLLAGCAFPLWYTASLGYLGNSVGLMIDGLVFIGLVGLISHLATGNYRYALWIKMMPILAAAFLVTLMRGDLAVWWQFYPIVLMMATYFWIEKCGTYCCVE